MNLAQQKQWALDALDTRAPQLATLGDAIWDRPETSFEEHFAARTLAAHGVPCSGHAARQLRKADYESYDLLIGMDDANIRNMQRMCGGDPQGKIHQLLDYTDRPGEVADPWYTGNFEATWRDVWEGCNGLLAQLRQH